MSQFIAIDLGTTNIKAGVYDEALRCIAMERAPVEYLRDGVRVEFDVEQLFDGLVRLLERLLSADGAERREVRNITLTGQAESLVVLGKNGAPLMNAISWMDERSEEECRQLARQFSYEEYYGRTGQTGVVFTWPAPKILWLRKHRPEVFGEAAGYVLLKDYIVYRLTGRLQADCSIATFSFYFDIYKKRYWKEMLDACGMSEGQLPPLAEPCTCAGELTDGLRGALGLAAGTSVNIGTLDHFAGMIGVGNTHTGSASLSIGTVMGLAVMAAAPIQKDTGVAMHYGFLPGSYVMLSVSESGGSSVEWIRNACMPDVTVEGLNAALARRDVSEVVFLPYLVGTNAPEMETDVSALFFGLRSQHDGYDMAYAVMEGVCHLLKKNCDYIVAAGTPIRRIIATGGGAKSALWCQLMADVTGLPVDIPAQKEAACLGAAMVGAVSAGAYDSYEQAAEAAVQFSHRYHPRENALLERKHRQFLALYDSMRAAQEMR